VEVHPVSDLIPNEPWFVCFRTAESTRASVAQFVDLFDATAATRGRE